MPRPLTRRQALENERFIEVLSQTGNARLAAREIRRANATMIERRAKHADFAQRWDAAVAAAHARFHLGGGKRGPSGSADAGAGGKKKKRDSRFRGNDGKGGPAENGRSLRTRGGEPVVVRTRSGKLQLRMAQPGKLTTACEQAFLSALAATANIRLSAAAAGASPGAFYRRREKNPAFAREFRLALRMGYERLEAAALCAALPESHADNGWRYSAPRPIPPMSQDQAMQLLFLHEKSVHQEWEKPHRRRRRGESDEIYGERLRAMWTAEQNRDAEAAALRRAARYEAEGDWRFEAEAPAAPLPPLHLVTGWSKADPGKKPHNPNVALFGGWRIDDMKRKMKGKP